MLMIILITMIINMHLMIIVIKMIINMHLMIILITMDLERKSAFFEKVKGK